MSFATPLAFALAALAVPIVVFYILKVRMRRMPVSTNLFWRQIYDEKPPRSIWQNLRHLLSLLAQLAFLGMLVLAIADPYLPWQLLQARRIVLVVDNSASMQAGDVAPTRLDAAKAYALDLIDGLRERDQVAVVIAGMSPEVVVGMTGHAPTLRRAVESIEPADTPTHLEAAVRLGEKLVGDHPHGQVLVLTDGCTDELLTGLTERPVAGGLARGLARAEEVTGEETGAVTGLEAYPTEAYPTITYQLFNSPIEQADANNIGITQFQVRRSLTDSLGYEILASVLNASTSPVRCRLEITLNDLPVDVVPLKLQPGELWKRAFEKTSVDGGTLVGQLSRFEPLAVASDDEQGLAPEDGTALGNDAKSEAKRSETTAAASEQLNCLAVDDTAWAVLPARKPQQVLIVSPGNHFLRKVFEASPLVELKVTDALPEAWPADTLIVLHRLVPPKLPPGKVLVIDPTGDSDLWRVTGQIADPIVTQQSETSPLMTHISLENVVLPNTSQLEFVTPTESLAATITDAPVYTNVRRDNGKCLVLLVNLEESDLAFRTAFPIMITNALNWYSESDGQLQPSIATGSLLNIELPERFASHSQQLWLGGPGAEAFEAESNPSNLEVQVEAGELVPIAHAGEATTCNVGPFDRTGIWYVWAEANQGNEGSGAASTDESIDGDKIPESLEVVRQLAVNVSNQRESNLRPHDALVKADGGQALAGRWFTRPIWFYLALLAAVFTGAEWFLYHRRFIS